MVHFSLILFLHKSCNELEYMFGINLYGMHLRRVITAIFFTRYRGRGKSSRGKSTQLVFFKYSVKLVYDLSILQGRGIGSNFSS